MSSEEGGTKLQKRNRPQQMSQAPQPQFEPQQVYTRQQGPPQQQMPPQMGQQMPPQQQMSPQQQMQMAQQMGQQMPRPYQGIIKKPMLENSNTKSAILVVLIFLLLNSKIVWKQIINLPMMGSMEPSMVALIFNSLLAGIIFYIIINYLMK